MSKVANDGRNLAHALELLSLGRRIEEVWKEAGFSSQKQLSEALMSLSGHVSREGRSRARLKIVAHSDGASIGNPGEAGCGALLLSEDGSELSEESRYLGRATNNVAEYEGAILALEKARELGASEVELRLDSELVARQIKGEYRVKNPALADLYQRLKRTAKHFDKFEVKLISRKHNKRADSLANLAIAAHKEERSGAG